MGVRIVCFFFFPLPKVGAQSNAQTIGAVKFFNPFINPFNLSLPNKLYWTKYNLTSYIKINSKWIMDLNVNHRTKNLQRK
jgi:hypothetical protein